MVPDFIMLTTVAKSQGLHILSSDTCCQTVFQKTAPTTNTDFQPSIRRVTGPVLPHSVLRVIMQKYISISIYGTIL